MSGVFISYARDSEGGLAWRLVLALRALGVHVWWDQDMPSVDWQYELVDRIDELSAVIVLWSEHSQKRKAVRNEARLADDLDKLINLLVGVAKPLHPFDRITGVPIDGWAGPGSHALWTRVVKSIEDRMVASGAMKPGELMARQAAEYAEYQRREREVADASARQQAAERAASAAVDAIEEARAGLAEAEADIARLPVSGLSPAVRNAALGEARAERERLQARLEAAGGEASAATAEAGAMGRERDRLQGEFDEWLRARGGIGSDGDAAVYSATKPNVPPPAPIREAAPPTPPPAPPAPPPPPPVVDSEPAPPRRMTPWLIAAFVAALMLVTAIIMSGYKPGSTPPDGAAPANVTDDAMAPPGNTVTAADGMRADDRAAGAAWLFRSWGTDGNCAQKIAIERSEAINTIIVKSADGDPSVQRVVSAAGDRVETDQVVFETQGDGSVRMTWKGSDFAPYRLTRCG